MKVNIYYFSGTGNTAWMVRQLATHLVDLGNTVSTDSCETVMASDVDVSRCNMVGVAFPVHASFAPVLFRDFLRDLPEGNNTPLFAITTAGYAAGDTAWYAVHPLRDKGYAPFLMNNVNIANNLHLPGISPLPVGAQETMPRKLARADQKIAQLAIDIHQQQARTNGVDLFGRVLGITQRWGIKHFEPMMFKGFVADETCTQCGWCVQHCPVHNIKMTGDGVQFGDQCMACMRCYSFCPAQALQSTDATRNVKKYRRYKGPEGKARF